MKEYFIDWYESIFPYGYGTGESYILPALKQFFSLVDDRGVYNHNALEAALGPVAAWLLIDAMIGADIFEYGTSPRHAWLTRKGQRLKALLDFYSAEELYEWLGHDESRYGCSDSCCNCDGEPKSYACPYNPFFNDKPKIKQEGIASGENGE